MSHLSLETIARIVDDGPSAEENRHLDGCAACRAELDAMRDDVQALGMLPDVAPAPDQWTAIEQRLVDEGLLHTQRRVVWYSGPRMLRTAAAVVLFLGGTMAGRGLADGGSRAVAQLEPDAPAAATQQPSPYPPTSQVQPVVNEPVMPAPSPSPNVTLASNTGFRATTPRNVQEAAALLREAEDIYLTLLTRYAELSSQSQAGDPVARLAALQSIVMTTQAALNQTPTDPVINGYHLTALAQRDAALRQVASRSGEAWY